jgi:hypothetical protein
MSHRWLIVACLLNWILLLALTVSSYGADPFTWPWNLAELQRPPQTEFGQRQGLLQTVYYQGEPLQGKATRVFAYLGRSALLTKRLALRAAVSVSVRFPLPPTSVNGC